MSDLFKNRCSNCRKPKEPEEKLLCCGGCRQTNYCSVECQKAAWSEHKTCCKLLKETKEQVLADAENVDPSVQLLLRSAMPLTCRPNSLEMIPLMQLQWV